MSFRIVASVTITFEIPNGITSGIPDGITSEILDRVTQFRGDTTVKFAENEWKVDEIVNRLFFFFDRVHQIVVGHRRSAASFDRHAHFRDRH